MYHNGGGGKSRLTSEKRRTWEFLSLV